MAEVTVSSLAVSSFRCPVLSEFGKLGLGLHPDLEIPLDQGIWLLNEIPLLTLLMLVVWEECAMTCI